MTPARFDFFYAVSRGGSSLQREIQRALGVSGATVSKMVKRLKELGLVRSCVAGEDGRKREITMTRKAHSLFARAMRIIFFRETPIKRTFNRCFYGHATLAQYRSTWAEQLELFEKCVSFANLFRVANTPRDSADEFHECVSMLYRITKNPFD